MPEAGLFLHPGLGDVLQQRVMGSSRIVPTFLAIYDNVHWDQGSVPQLGLNLHRLLDVMEKICSVFSSRGTKRAGRCSCLHVETQSQRREARGGTIAHHVAVPSVFSASAR